MTGYEEGRLPPTMTDDIVDAIIEQANKQFDDVEMTIGVSFENAKCLIDEQYNINRNPYRWAKDMYNLLHIRD